MRPQLIATAKSIPGFISHNKGDFFGPSLKQPTSDWRRSRKSAKQTPRCRTLKKRKRRRSRWNCRPSARTRERKFGAGCLRLWEVQRITAMRRCWQWPTPQLPADFFVLLFLAFYYGMIMTYALAGITILESRVGKVPCVIEYHMPYKPQGWLFGTTILQRRRIFGGLTRTSRTLQHTGKNI